MIDFLLRLMVRQARIDSWHHSIIRAWIPNPYNINQRVVNSTHYWVPLIFYCFNDIEDFSKVRLDAANQTSVS